jgi:hypothetical protein
LSIFLVLVLLDVYLFFVDLRKKNWLGPVCEPQLTVCHYYFFSNIIWSRTKTLIWEGPNLSSIPELLGFGSKNPAVFLVDRKSSLRIQNLKIVGWKMIKKIGYRRTDRQTDGQKHVLWQCKEQRKKDKRVIWRKKYERKEKRSKNAGRFCKNHRIILRTMDIKTQIGTKKERTRNDNEDRKRKLELIKNWKVKIKKQMYPKIRLCKPKISKRINKPITIYLSAHTYGAY